MTRAPRQGRRGRSPAADVKMELEELERTGQQGTIQFERAVLFDWFRQHLVSGRLSPLHRGANPPHAIDGEIQKALSERGIQTSRPTAEFVRTNYSKFTLSDIAVSEIIGLLHKIPTVATDPELLSSWRAARERISKRYYRFRDVLSAKGKPTPYDDSPLRGEYLLFRCAKPKEVSLSFLRFYPHREGGTRYQELFLGNDAIILGAKGWLVRQSGGVAITGYMTRQLRDGSGFDYAGGTCLRWVASGVTDRRCIGDGDHIYVAPALCMQAHQDSPAGASRAVILKLSGVETSGGSADLKLNGRKTTVAALHQKLSADLPITVTTKKAAQLLHRHIGIGVRTFGDLFDGVYRTKENKGPMMPLRAEPIKGKWPLPKDRKIADMPISPKQLNLHLADISPKSTGM